jgi:plastocyanin
MKHIILLCTAVIALLCIAGCTQIDQLGQPAGGSSPGATPQVTAAPTLTSLIPTTSSVSDNTVIIQKMAFNPAQITVSAGSIVRWVNKDTVTHSVLFPASTHISMFALSPGQAFSQRFSTPGMYNYTCSIYSSMQGTVIVTS